MQIARRVKMPTTVTMSDLLRLLFQRAGSDLHLSPGSPPMLRLNGQIIPTELGVLTVEDAQSLIYSVLTDEQKEKI